LMIVFSAGTIAAIDAGQRIEKVTRLLLFRAFSQLKRRLL